MLDWTAPSPDVVAKPGRAIRDGRGRAGIRNTPAHAADPVREHGRSGTAESGAMTGAGSCVSSSLILTLWSALSSRCLRLIQLRPRSRGGQVFGKSQEKHCAVRLGQTEHGAPNDGWLVPGQIQAITALVVANEVGGDLHQPRPNAGCVPKLLPRQTRLDEPVASRFRANSRARSDAGQKKEDSWPLESASESKFSIFPEPCSSGHLP
jgi:hypothetical protein